MTRAPRHAATLPGFEGIARYHDAKLGSDVAKLLPGEYYVTMHAETLVTVLGSCVSACVRDAAAHVGGMNHFMLPEGDADGRWAGQVDVTLATRYGNHAMESLLNEVFKRGGRRDRLEIKLFGGGRMLTGMTDVGRRNIDFVHQFLATESLHARAEDLGGEQPRKIYYEPRTGAVRVRYLRVLSNDTIAEREREYRRRLEAEASQAGSVDLF